MSFISMVDTLARLRREAIRNIKNTARHALRDISTSTYPSSSTASLLDSVAESLTIRQRNAIQDIEITAHRTLHDPFHLTQSFTNTISPLLRLANTSTAPQGQKVAEIEEEIEEIERSTSFLDLPRELRDEIYGIAFANIEPETSLLAVSLVNPPRCFRRHFIPLNLPLQLLRVNQQFNEETGTILYGKPFLFQGFGSLIAFIDQIGRRHIRYLCKLGALCNQIAPPALRSRLFEAIRLKSFSLCISEWAFRPKPLAKIWVRAVQSVVARGQYRMEEMERWTRLVIVQNDRAIDPERIKKEQEDFEWAVARETRRRRYRRRN